MSDETGKVVIAGCKVFASISNNVSASVCRNAIVIEFKTPKDLAKAITAGKAEFTVFQHDPTNQR